MEWIKLRSLRSTWLTLAIAVHELCACSASRIRGKH
jgi:hypothetical protein